MHDSLGKIVVTTPGVPVRATINRPNPAEPFYVHGYAIQRLRSNVGDVYISLSPTDNRTLLSRIICILTKTQPSVSGGVGVEVNGTNMAEIYIDADTGGDGVIIGLQIS